MVDLIKEGVKIYNISTLKIQDTAYEHNCIIPDQLPDGTKIASVSVHPETVNVEKTQEGTKIIFNLIYDILYIAEQIDEENLNVKYVTKAFSTISSHVAFTKEYFENNENIIPQYSIDDIESELVNSRKLSIKTILNIQITAKNSKEESICYGIESIDDIQIQKENVQITISNEVLNDSISISESIELSGAKAPYKEILKNDVNLCDVSTIYDTNNIQIKGILEISTLYIADDSTESMQIIENEINFSHIIPINCDENTKWYTELNLSSLEISIDVDSDNQNRLLQISGKIDVVAYSYSSHDAEIMIDAYSLSKNLTLEKNTISAFQNIENVNAQFSIKEIVEISDELPAISQIVNVKANICDYSWVMDNDKIIISGKIMYHVLYISNDIENPVVKASIKSDFSQVIDSQLSEENVENFLKLLVNHVSFNIISSKEIELRITICVKGLQAKCFSFDTVCSATLEEMQLNEDEKPSILLYVVQPNDTIWKIAKRYNAPMEILKEINHINNPEIIYPGQKLLIPS